MIYGKEKIALPSNNEISGLWKNGVVLSFDLNTSNLKIYYSKNSPQNAYKLLKIFLKNNGFEHKKDSDYVNPLINRLKTVRLLTDFAKKNKWFPLCINKMNISPNVETLDISMQIESLIDKDWKNKKDFENLSK